MKVFSGVETQRAEQEVDCVSSWAMNNAPSQAQGKGVHTGPVISKTQVTGAGKDMWRPEDKVEKPTLS